MAIEITVDGIRLSDGLVEVVVTFRQAAGPTHNRVTVEVFIEDRDWSLSELKAEAIQKAKAFLSQLVSSPQN